MVMYFSVTWWKTWLPSTRVQQGIATAGLGKAPAVSVGMGFAGVVGGGGQSRARGWLGSAQRCGKMLNDARTGRATPRLQEHGCSALACGLVRGGTALAGGALSRCCAAEMAAAPGKCRALGD